MSTIFTNLLKLVRISEELGQHHILVTADLAIYSKAQQFLWSRPEPLEAKVTMGLGAMHMIMAFLASIGKIFGDGGLQNILTSSDVYMQLPRLTKYYKESSMPMQSEVSVWHTKLCRRCS